MRKTRDLFGNEKPKSAVFLNLFFTRGTPSYLKNTLVAPLALICYWSDRNSRYLKGFSGNSKVRGSPVENHWSNPKCSVSHKWRSDPMREGGGNLWWQYQDDCIGGWGCKKMIENCVTSFMEDPSLSYILKIKEKMT